MTDGPVAAEGGHYEVRIGNVSGQVVVGPHNTVIREDSPTPPVTQAQRAALREAFAQVRAKAADRGEEGRGAEEQLDKLEEAVTSADPDIPVMVSVRNWFLRTLPSLAGAVLGLIVHPVVGQLVQQAGDQFAVEYAHRFGAPSPNGDTRTP